VFQINYRQADTVVVVVVVVVDVVVVAAAGQSASDHADGLPHKFVDRDVAIGGPGSSNALADASAVGRRFRQLQINIFKFDFKCYSGFVKLLKIRLK